MLNVSLFTSILFIEKYFKLLIFILLISNVKGGINHATVISGI